MNIIFKIRADWQTASPKVIDSLGQIGFQAIQSFNLRIAAIEQGESCPYHSFVECDCEIIVLLLYASKSPIITLVGHCRDGVIEFNLVECLESRTIAEKISKAFLKAHKLLGKV